MYNEIKLEKGLYNLTSKSFSEALSESDPDSNYENTAMKGLDAYERQLKRFDIKVNGMNCDKVEKFFQSTESSVLFPEFVRRAVAEGMNSAVVSKIIAAKTTTNLCDFRGMTLSDGNTAYTASVEYGSAIPESTIALSSEIVSLKKFGRVINATYEAVRQQRLDVFAVALKAVGMQIGKAVTKQAVDTLISGITETAMTGETFSYAELVSFYGKFSDFEMNTIVCSPKTASAIYGFTEMNKAVTSSDKAKSFTPFGAEIVVTSAVADDIIIGMDRDLALEMVVGSDIIVDTDKLISQQIDKSAVSVTTGFSKIVSGAVKVLAIA